jgi:hypothetical protein
MGAEINCCAGESNEKNQLTFEPTLATPSITRDIIQEQPLCTEEVDYSEKPPNTIAKIYDINLVLRNWAEPLHSSQKPSN